MKPLISSLTLIMNLGLGLMMQPKLSGADHYLFTSFRGNGEDGLHLAMSTNGYQWKELNQGKSFLTPSIGGKLMRDPSLALGPDGRFHMVWTTSWTTEKGKWMGYATSKDLLHWTDQRGIEVMQSEPGTRNVWAPELFYDKAQKQWLIIWSSTVPGRFQEGANLSEDNYNHRFFYVTTRDFRTFSESRLLYDPGFNCIDAMVLAVGKKYYLVFKDERKNPVKKNLRYAVSDHAEGPYGEASEPFTGNWVEGPSAIKIKEDYLVYFDHYTNPHYYGAVRSRDLKTWQDCSKEMQFPNGHRHGTVLKIPAHIARNLQ